jgi:hypothetical protein
LGSQIGAPGFLTKKINIGAPNCWRAWEASSEPIRSHPNHRSSRQRITSLGHPNSDGLGSQSEVKYFFLTLSLRVPHSAIRTLGLDVLSVLGCLALRCCAPEIRSFSCSSFVPFVTFCSKFPLITPQIKNQKSQIENSAYSHLSHSFCKFLQILHASPSSMIPLG